MEMTEILRRMQGFYQDQGGDSDTTAEVLRRFWDYLAELEGSDPAPDPDVWIALLQGPAL